MSVPSTSQWQICHIITKLELGGAQLATLSQLEALTDVRQPAHLLYGPGEQLDNAAKQLLHVQHWPIPALTRQIHPLYDPLALLQLVGALKQIAKQQPQAKLLIHTHSSKAGILGRLAGFLAGAKLIVHSIHGFGHQPHEPWLRRTCLASAERLVSYFTDGFTADAQANLERAKQEGLWRQQQATVLRCGIDCSPYGQLAPELAKQQLGLAENTPLVLGIACLKTQKSPLAFLQVAALICQQRPDVAIWLAGDGPLRSACEQFIAHHRLAPRIKLLGWRHDIARLLAASKVLLHTARHEGLPQAFMQAMASSVPIVATDVDGAREAIAEGVNGYLLPYGSWSAMAKQVEYLLANPPLAAAMGQAGLAKLAPFTSQAMQQQLLVWYEQLQSQAEAC